MFPTSMHSSSPLVRCCFARWDDGPAFRLAMLLTWVVRPPSGGESVCHWWQGFSCWRLLLFIGMVMKRGFFRHSQKKWIPWHCHFFFISTLDFNHFRVFITFIPSSFYASSSPPGCVYIKLLPPIKCSVFLGNWWCSTWPSEYGVWGANYGWCVVVGHLHTS